MSHCLTGPGEQLSTEEQVLSRSEMHTDEYSINLRVPDKYTTPPLNHGSIITESAESFNPYTPTVVADYMVMCALVWGLMSDIWQFDGPRDILLLRWSSVPHRTTPKLYINNNWPEFSTVKALASSQYNSHVADYYVSRLLQTCQYNQCVFPSTEYTTAMMPTRSNTLLCSQCCHNVQSTQCNLSSPLPRKPSDLFTGGTVAQRIWQE